MKVLSRDRIPQGLFLACTTAVAFWAGGRWLDPMSDGGFAWSLAWRLGHGEVLYRNIHFAYGPLSPYLLTASGLPFGFSSLWYLLANWIPAVLAGCLLLECGRRYLTVLGGIALAALALGFSLFVPGTGRLVLPYYPGVVHALVFSLAALLVLQASIDRPGPLAYVAGAFAGLALCCKPEIGLAALLSLWVASVAGMPGPKAWALRVLTGFVAVAGVAFLFALSCDSLASLRDHSHVWPLNPSPPPEFARFFRTVAGLTDPAWPLAVRSAAFWLLCYVGLLALLAMLLARERLGRRWLPLAAIFGALAVWFLAEGFDLLHPQPAVCLSMLAAFLVALLAMLRRGVQGRPFLVSFGVFAGFAGARTAFSPFTSGAYDAPAHFSEALTWTLLLCVFVPALLTGGGAALPWARRVFAVAILVVAAPYVETGVEAMRFPSRLPVDTPRGRVYANGPDARFLELLGRELHGGERALVLPEICAVDALFEVKQASPFLTHLPGWLDSSAEARLIERLDRNPPDVVVLFDRPTTEYGVEPFGKGFGVFLSRWCREHYEPVASTSAGLVLRPGAGSGLLNLP
jgi:fluoride ion exporter CrcB/FEX